MKVLHIASFVGNIGDNANHTGMRNEFQSWFPGEHSFTELEIRKCYRIYSGADRWTFDETFAKMANDHDFVIIGGGNFFEPWLTESETGTTIALGQACLDRIQSPLLFYGVGFDTYKPAAPECLIRFSEFLTRLHQRPNTWVSFRNDGSYANYEAVYGEQPPGVSIVPDGAFFYPFDLAAKTCMPIESNKAYWGVNVASDMLEQRFPGGEPQQKWSRFLAQLAATLEQHLDARPELNIILMPHMFKDVQAAGELMMALDDRFNRDRVLVAPCLSGFEGARAVFDLYQHCELVMGMRFHSVICSIAAGVPSIPLSSTPKLADLFGELGLQDQVVACNQAKFQSALKARIMLAMNNRKRLSQQTSRLIEDLRYQSGDFWQGIQEDLLIRKAC